MTISDIKQLEDLNVVKELSTSTRTRSFLAFDEYKRALRVSYLDKERCINRIQMNLYREEENLSHDTVKSRALAQYKEMEEEFKVTAERVIGLQHPNIAEIFKIVYDKENDRYVVIGEYVPGTSMFQESQGFTPIQTVCLFVQGLEALKFIHKQGMLHLNVKSKNVYVTMEGSGYVTKFLDYGFAIPMKGYEGDFRGTALYMAPEVVMGWNDKINERADLYSYAALMYYCLARRLPFPGRTKGGMSQDAIAKEVDKESMIAPIGHFTKEVPKTLENVIMQLLEKDPDKRGYDSAGDVLRYFYKNWPIDSREMPFEKTFTVQSEKSIHGLDEGKEVPDKEETVVKNKRKK